MSLEDNLTRVVERYAELATAMSRQGEECATTNQNLGHPLHL